MVAHDLSGESMRLMTFRKVRCPSRSNDAGVTITLFRDEIGRVCGWFIGPVRIAGDGVTLPYLPRSKRTLASIAVVRAIEASKASSVPVCIVDPHDLWEPAWA